MVEEMIVIFTFPMTIMQFIYTFLKVPPNVTTTPKAFNTAPTLLWWVSEENMDFALDTIAYIGLALSGFLVLWGAGNAFIFALLWMLYHSLVNVGQRWYVGTIHIPFRVYIMRGIYVDIHNSSYGIAIGTCNETRVGVGTASPPPPTHTHTHTHTHTNSSQAEERQTYFLLVVSAELIPSVHHPYPS